MSWDAVLARLEALAAQVPAAGLAAVEAGQTPVLAASQERVPVDTGLLRSTGLAQQEALGTMVRGRLSYGNEETLSGWGGRQSAGFGGHGRRRQAGPIWANVGYEIFVHEGTSEPGHPPVKFLEGPLLEQLDEIGPRMGAAFQTALEA